MIKNFFSGIKYNYNGLKLGLKTPKLLFLGMVRFVIIVALTVFSAALVLAYYHEILNLMWSRPESAWIAWLWHLASWLLALVLVGLSAVVSFLLSQLLFSVLIMDAMSRITERKVSGADKTAEQTSSLKYFFYLVKQEIPRAVIPVLIALTLTILGWLTPLGPFLAAVSSIAAAIFLAWDNTDLIPARRLEPFGGRFKFMVGNLWFHLGFGIWFLVPGLNILFLSFAPVGAALFYVERIDGRRQDPDAPQPDAAPRHRRP